MTTATTVSPTLREPQLLGQTVVVIGGSAGIGLETARRARAEGASVVLTGRNPDRLERAARAGGPGPASAFQRSDNCPGCRSYRPTVRRSSATCHLRSARTRMMWSGIDTCLPK